MADAPRVLRESAVKATVTPLPGSRPPPAQQGAPQPAAPPEPKRTKSERLHQSSGYWAGACHGGVMGLAIGLAAMFFAFLGAAPILADLQGRLAAIDAAKAEMVGK